MEYNSCMSFFSFLKKNKESYSLVFNIGSGSVSGGIIRFTEKAGVDVVHYAYEPITFQDEISIPKHLELMKNSLTLLAGKLQAEGLKKITSKNGRRPQMDRIFYVFSSPWCASQTKVIKVKESKAFKVTEIYLNRLVAEQEKKLQVDISLSGEVIEKKIIQIKVNGYSLNDIYGKIVKDLELSVFFTVVPSEILQTVEKAVSSTFNVKDVWCHSLSLSIFSVIRNFFPLKDDFIYMDVSEEITDISVVRDNTITNEASLPFGRNDFIRELSRVLKVSPQIADSMIKMQSTKNNDELAAMKLAVAMDKAAQDWLARIFSVLNSLKDKIYVPEAIFLIANQDLNHFLKEKLQRQDFKVELLDNRKIRPSTVGEDVIFKIELLFLDNLYKI